MNFVIETGDLQRAIKLLSVTAKVNVLDPSGMVLIQAGEDGLVRFYSDNSATALSCVSNKTAVQTPGAAVIEYGKIKSFVSAFQPWNETFGAKEFHFELSEHSLKISVVNVYENGKTAKGNLKLKIFELRRIRERRVFGEANFMVNSIIFKTATNKILYAINPSDTRAFLQGMNVVFDGDEICFVGTDGKRLSEYKVKNKSDIKEGVFLLKYDFVMGLRRALGEDTQIEFEFDNRDVKARFEDVCFWGSPVVGREFPEYKPILESFEHKILLDKDVLMSSLLPFSDILDPDDNYRVTFELKNGRMFLKNTAADFEYDGEIEHDDDFVIDVDGQAMIQTIEAIKDDRLCVYFSDDNGVLIFDSYNYEDQKALITPLRRRYGV